MGFIIRILEIAQKLLVRLISDAVLIDEVFRRGYTVEEPT